MIIPLADRATRASFPTEARIGGRVSAAARRRGAVLRPLGDVIVLMPPLAISKRDLRRLVTITAESIRAAIASAYGSAASPAAPEALAA